MKAGSGLFRLEIVQEVFLAKLASLRSLGQVSVSVFRFLGCNYGVAWRFSERKNNDHREGAKPDEDEKDVVENL